MWVPGNFQYQAPKSPAMEEKGPFVLQTELPTKSKPQAQESQGSAP